MSKTATSGKLTNDATLTNIYEKYVCKKYYSYYIGTSILGDPGAVSWVRKNGVESFQEWARVPLGCYSWRTSFTTYSNNCLWFGKKNNLVPNKKPVSIPLLSRFSYTRKVNRKLDCSTLAGELSSAKMEPTKPKKFYNTPIPEKKKNGSCMEVRLNGLGGKFKITNRAVPAKDWPRFWRSNFELFS